jgi:hypothetical protein|tara:strand:+ start:896 stop:1438 length:543 start_codon:yes stop_codon:yes gene_type:complete
LNLHTIKKYTVGKVQIFFRNIAKQRTVRDYAKRFSADTFVETGTFRGNMVNTVKDVFSSIRSIELNDTLYREADGRFKKYKHISIIHGDSGEVMPVKAHLYWLDAHYSAGVTAKSFPIMKELGRIEDFSVILIDDARMFRGGNYPTVEEVKAYVSKRWPDSDLEVKNDIIRITKRRGRDE